MRQRRANLGRQLLAAGKAWHFAAQSINQITCYSSLEFAKTSALIIICLPYSRVYDGRAVQLRSRHRQLLSPRTVAMEHSNKRVKSSSGAPIKISSYPSRGYVIPPLPSVTGSCSNARIGARGDEHAHSKRGVAHGRPIALPCLPSSCLVPAQQPRCLPPVVRFAQARCLLREIHAIRTHELTHRQVPQPRQHLLLARLTARPPCD